MRILSTVFFLSLLAGKFTTFKQILLRIDKEKTGACVLKLRVFVSFLAGKNFHFKQRLTLIKLTKIMK